MSYGQNQSSGLQAELSINGGTWNGQVNPYFIKSGYGTSIFRGDLVYVGTDGYLHNLLDLGAQNVYGIAQAVGVFNGCSFEVPTAINPIDPASPGKPYWPANQTTPNGLYATAFVIDDPSVVYNVQSNATGLAWSAQGYTFYSSYDTVTPGNTSTGVSTLTIDGSTAGGALATKNLRVVRFIPTKQTIPVPLAAAVPFINAQVLIQNHSYAQRAVGL